MEQFPENTVLFFYCDTGKTTKKDLNIIKKFPKYKCISLKGGRGYFQTDLRLNDKLDKMNKRVWICYCCAGIAGCSLAYFFIKVFTISITNW